MFKSGKLDLDEEENNNELESIIKTEPERFENDKDQSEINKINRKSGLWPRVIVKNILLPNVNLKRLSAKEIDRLTTDQPASSKNVRKNRPPTKIKPDASKYKCEDCVETFAFRYERSRHILKVHYQGEKFECDCGKLHRFKSSFYACRSSHRSKSFDCKLCQRKFTSRGALLGHWKRVHFKKHGPAEIDNLINLKNDGNFTCDVCGRVLKGRKAILRHLTYQHFNPDLSCDLCPYTVKRIGDLRIHMDRHHLNVKPYHCHLCKYKTAFQTNLRSHKKRHPEFGVMHVKSFVVCKICKKKLPKYNLKQHMKCVHDLNCRKCCKSFESHRELAKHYKNKHSEDKKTTCQVCGEAKLLKTCRCLYKEKLKSKKHRCDICKKKYSNRLILRDHYYRNHSAPLTCDLCAEEKTSRFEIITHMKHHLRWGVQCGICPFNGISKMTVDTHIEQKHRKVKKEIPDTTVD